LLPLWTIKQGYTPQKYRAYKTSAPACQSVSDCPDPAASLRNVRNMAGTDAHSTLWGRLGTRQNRARMPLGSDQL
jgi:hypothetical protein